MQFEPSLNVRHWVSKIVFASPFKILAKCYIKILIVGFNYPLEQWLSWWFINYCYQLEKNFLPSHESANKHIVSQKNVYGKFCSFQPSWFSYIHMVLDALQFIKRNCFFVIPTSLASYNTRWKLLMSNQHL